MIDVEQVSIWAPLSVNITISKGKPLMAGGTEETTSCPA